jgi:hypothetical protein
MSESHDTTPVEYRFVGDDAGYRVGSDGIAWTSLVQMRRPGRRCGFDFVPSAQWRRLRPGSLDSGHLVVVIRRRSRQVHRLVLEAFVGPCPPGLECRHLNGRPDDNRLENLAWGTRLENVADSLEHGAQARGIRMGGAKLNDDLVRWARHAHRDGWSHRRIARQLGVDRNTAWRVVNDRTWTHVE